jgi:hypothetical protein
VSTVAGVPEPASGSLLLTGIVLLGVAIRCKFQIASYLIT